MEYKILNLTLPLYELHGASFWINLEIFLEFQEEFQGISTTQSNSEDVTSVTLPPCGH